MKVVVAALAVSLFMFAQSFGSGVYPLKEFDLQPVATGDWNPVAIDWDASGRMWAAVTSDDPLQPRTSRQDDRILVFENGSHPERVFASGCPQVGGFVLHRDGVIVVEASQIVYRSGGQRRVVFSGFGADDEPAELSNLRQGMDGWIYAALGRGADRCVKISGARSFGRIDGGIIRFKPDGSAIESVSSFRDTGASFDFTWDNEVFLSRANGSHVSQLGLPEKYFTNPGISNAASYRAIEDHKTLFAPFPGGDRFIQVAPRAPFARPSGAAIYDGGAWPERYQGNFYVCDPVLRVIHEDVISRPESAYCEGTRRFDGEFLTAGAPEFRPHGLGIGPDGAMYILVGSMTRTPHATFVSPRYPHAGRPLYARGAIWRLQHKQAREFSTPGFANASAETLTHALEHANSWVRRTAFRLLVEHGGARAVPLLENMVRSNRLAHARVSALWALHHLAALTDSTWTNALEDMHFSVQRNAWLAFLESDKPVIPGVERIISKQYKDADQRVRLAMLMALAKGPLTSGGRETAIKLFPDLKDVWSKSAVLTIARSAPMDAIKLAFASDKSEHYRELVVPLVKDFSPEDRAVSSILELTRKHAKAEKLTAAVKEAIAPPR